MEEGVEGERDRRRERGRDRRREGKKTLDVSYE